MRLAGWAGAGGLRGQSCEMKCGCPLCVRVSTSQPTSVTSSVCSNCADRLPSRVTAVQSSGHVSSRHVPDTATTHDVTHRGVTGNRHSVNMSRHATSLTRRRHTTSRTSNSEQTQCQHVSSRHVPDTATTHSVTHRGGNSEQTQCQHVSDTASCTMG